MIRFLASLAVAAVILGSAVQPAEAHHGLRATPFRPFVGPVPRRSNFNGHHGFNNVNAFHHVDPFAFRGYSSFYQPLSYYQQPATVVLPAPQQIVYQQPAPVVAYQPQPVVTYQQPAAYRYEARSYSTNGQPQAFRQEEQVYVLPDGRTVLPNGVVVQPQ